MGRAPCCDKANVKKGPWSPEEDFKLKSYIHNHGTCSNWIALPQKIGLKRCGKSCRLRWLNYLRPNIKHGSFTEEEDNIICSLYISIGSRWSIIAAQLPGRTDNDIKNYWNTRLKKKLLGRHRKSSSSPISGQGDVGASDLNSLSSSALERLQLHMQLHTPLSLYDINPASFWPKLNHLQQRMIETLHSLNQNQLSSSSSASASASASAPPPLGPDYTVDCSSGSQVPPQFNAIRDSDSIGFALHEQADAEGLIDARPCSFVNLQAVGDEFDCIKEMEGGGAKENVAWWCNAFEASSWESTAVIRRSEEINGDYDGMGFRI